jgi:hypothetical protein
VSAFDDARELLGHALMPAFHSETPERRAVQCGRIVGIC